MKKFTAIDLFCGAGGLSLGLKQAGFNVIAGVEIHEPACETYLLNHKNHKLYSQDIRTIDLATLMNELNLEAGQLDLLAGCPPCQGFSTHRTRNKSFSVHDERNDLVFEFLRFTTALLPKTIMMENVPGLAKDERIKELLNQLAKLGYVINKDSLGIKNAADYGVPQRRKRMILQASRFGPIPQPKPSKSIKTVRETIGKLKMAGSSGDPLHDIAEIRSEKTRNLIQLIPKNGGSRNQIPQEFWLPCHLKSPDSYRDVYGRMHWDSVSPTITGGCHNPSKGRFLHPEDNRAITLREAALLQSFPKSYIFPISKGKEAIALMIGNALPPELIKRHAKKIYQHLEMQTQG